MGMFDTIICNYPLPGSPPAYIKPGHDFQTKDLDCSLSTYTIKEDGRMTVRELDIDGGQTADVDIEDFTGTIVFYTTNVCGVGPGVYTKDGDDAISVDYRAVFIDGKLIRIEEIDRETKPALPSSRQAIRHFVAPSEEERKARKEREAESLVGKQIYMMRPLEDHGRYCDVIAENEKELVVQCTEDKGFKIVDRRLRDNVFWDTEAEARAYVDAKKESWERERQEYDQYCVSKQTTV